MRTLLVSVAVLLALACVALPQLPNSTKESAGARFDGSFLNCWHERKQFSSRSLKTDVLSSGSGNRAYAVVTATGKGEGSCENTTALFVSTSHSVFRTVYTRSASGTQDGNGIQLIGWSPDGQKLLAVATDWAYGSDAALGKIAVIYDTASGKSNEVPVFPQLVKFFGEECGLDFLVQGWTSDHSFTVMGIQKAALDETQKTGCNVKPRVFTLDTATGVLTPIASP
jgi:hypothetical protein